jgi:hypothetical protein
MFSSNRTPEGKRKDTVINAESTGYFAWNLATYALREQMNITAQQLDPKEDEFCHAGLEKEDAKTIPVPLVKASPVRFECQFDRVIELPGNPPMGTVCSLPPSGPPPESSFLSQKEYAANTKTQRSTSSSAKYSQYTSLIPF